MVVLNPSVVWKLIEIRTLGEVVVLNGSSSGGVITGKSFTCLGSNAAEEMVPYDCGMIGLKRASTLLVDASIIEPSRNATFIARSVRLTRVTTRLAFKLLAPSFFSMTTEISLNEMLSCSVLTSEVHPPARKANAHNMPRGVRNLLFMSRCGFCEL